MVADLFTFVILMQSNYLWVIEACDNQMINSKYLQSIQRISEKTWLGLFNHEDLGFNSLHPSKCWML